MATSLFPASVLLCLVGVALAAWNVDKPFEDAGTAGVTFVDSDVDNTRIQMEENMPPNSIIAKMNFDDESGALPAPVITSFDDQKTNELLGARAEKDSQGDWYLIVEFPQDYETPTQRDYGFYFATGATGLLGHRVFLVIENVNDIAPVMNALENECKIDENTVVTGPESTCTFSVLDRDGDVEKTTFSIPDPLFSIVYLEVTDPYNAKVALTVNTTGLDYEKFTLHILAIEAKDEAANSFSTSYVVQVGDLPDTDPVWNSPIVPQTIVEEEPATIQVKASDGDVGINAVIDYKLEFIETTDSQFFSIDSDGLISVNKIDRDVLDNDIFRFTVTAFEKDNPGAKISATMVVIVDDINDNFPEISLTDSEIAIDEGSAQPLDFNISVNDPDLAEFGQFNIELRDESGNDWNQNFFLIPTVGYQNAAVTIAVKNAAALDFENELMRRMTLLLVATEQKDSSRSRQQSITVTLNDLNDESPIFDEPDYQVRIFENAKKGDFVATVKATDLDDGDVVTHTLSSQQNILAIDPVSGRITVAADKAFDYERQTDLIVQVTATDGADHKTYAQLVINIDDVNDTPPNLEMPTEQPSVQENTLSGNSIDAIITGTDVDLDADLLFRIDWDKSYATKQGARVVSSLYTEGVEISTAFPDPVSRGSVTASLKIVKDFLDFEAFDILALNIVVEDLMTLDEFISSRTKTAILSIQIEDLNDNKPQFTQDSIDATRTVFESSATDQLIGSVTATDADGPGFNTITYSISKADDRLPDFLVMIDPVKGEIRVNESAIDCDDVYGDKMKYSVTASDGEPDNDSLLEITIDIIDLNDNIPENAVVVFTYPLMENSPSGTPITTVKATDKDFSAPFHTVSYFIDAKDNAKLNELFKVDLVTGELTVELNTDTNAVLDRDPPGSASYEIPITFRDNYQQGSNSPITLFSETRITVVLSDENDNAPVFPEVSANECAIGCLACPLESTPANWEIIIIQAIDIDEGENAAVSYDLLSTVRLPGGSDTAAPADLFKIETTTDSKGKISVTAALDNLWGDYNIELYAEDHGVKPMSSKKTYKICVLDINDHDPEILYPIATESIRLREDQNINSPLYDINDNEVKLFTATDEDFGPNAEVTFSITGEASATAYFTVVNGVENTGELQLLLELQPETPPFQLTVTATDGGTPERSSSVTVNVVILNSVNVPPEFSDPRTWDVSFIENEVNLTAMINQEATDKNNLFIDPSDPLWDAIYYYIIDDGSSGLEFFDLDKNTGELSLKKPLDREEYATHELYILASNLASRPNNIGADSDSPSQLVLNVKVQDVNDNPPVFDLQLFPGGVSTGDKNGKVVLTVTATDRDEDELISFIILKDTIIADPTLENIKNNAFILDEIKGELTLNFDVVPTMSGFLMFEVKGFDKAGDVEGHTATTSVKVFVIADSNRVKFKFLNELDDVNSLKLEMMDVFTRVIGYDCAIDEVVKSTDSTGSIIPGETEVTTHFIDTVNNQPVDNSVITGIVNNREKIVELKAGFFGLTPPLELADYDSGNETPLQSSEALLRIILIAVSVILGLLVIILFAAFFIKTRSLNRRLEALSTTKFGSQDSGLNRVGMNVPGANKRAVEGSNPVWNEDIGAYDNISQGSYDSDLIGIEENPEFNTTTVQRDPSHVNVGFDGDVDVDVGRRVSVNPLQENPRRQSINPLSNAGTMRGLSHQVSIDSTASDDESVIEQANSNFSFATKDDSIPVTEL